MRIKQMRFMNPTYKEVYIFLFTALLMLSCGNKTGDKHSEEYIRQRIDTIYKTVGKTTYDSNGNEVSYINNSFNRDSAYCSQRYYTLMQKAMQICNENDEILYDYDHWVCGQDWSEDWSCKVAEVYELTDSTALVELDIHNFSDLKTTIALRFERNDWYIDDFSPSKDGNDDKKYLRDTIRKGLNKVSDGLEKEISL